MSIIQSILKERIIEILLGIILKVVGDRENKVKGLDTKTKLLQKATHKCKQEMGKIHNSH